MKRTIIILIALTIMLTPVRAEAKTIYRYSTKTQAMKEQANKKSHTIDKLHRNDKVIVMKKGKKWSRIRFANNIGYCKTNALHAKRSPKKYTRKQFKHRGVIRWGGVKWTWYTQRQLPGRGLKIPGRHVDKNGFVCDKDDYIVLASSIGYKKQRKILPTPFGKYGKVYDTNGTWNYGWRDVYTNW